MPVRTSYANVSVIIELDPSIVSDDNTLLPFATVANELVTEFCVPVPVVVDPLCPPCPPDPAPVPYTDVRLELIERWLTAHFYTNRDPRAVSEGAGTVSTSYQSKVDLGFDTSFYGQTAMRLDTAGGLARLNEIMKKGRPKLKVSWAGSKCANYGDGGRTWQP